MRLALPVAPPLQLYLLAPQESQLTRPAEYFVHCIAQAIGPLFKGMQEAR